VWGWVLPEDAAVPVNAVSGWRLDVSHFLPAKQRAIAAHKSQYGGMITDDPSGFQLPPALLATFETPFETFLPA
jgi:LmbE family N-acetylglucosaminyl deacetylase